MALESTGVLEFGSFRIDRDQRLLIEGSDVIPLAPKVFDTLLALAESGGRILEKENLLQKVWPDAFVEEGSLARNISFLRKALGEGPHDQKYIVTVPKRGYRFVARVTATVAPESSNGAPVSAGAAPCRESQTFVGRDAETQRLAALFERMLRGSGRLIFLAGEAGIGKSALAEEFLRTVRRADPGLLIASGRAVEQYGTGEPYLPFLDALAGLLRAGGDTLRAILRVHAPTWCLQLPAFGSGKEMEQLRRETAGATRDRMMREMGDALGALSSSAPLVILLEDLHWADPSTVDLLRHLCHRVTSQRVLLLATVRPEDIQIGNHPLKNCKIEMIAHQECEELALDVLSDEEVDNLLALRFRPNRFPAEFAGLIRKRTDGQPLFTVSLLEFLAVRGDIARVNSDWELVRPLGEMDLEIPDTVRAMIRKKGEALQPGQRLALQYASVEGEEFLSTVLASLLETDELKVEEQLAALAGKHHLIERRGEEELPDGALATRYAFAHALYQNVFYDELVCKRRELLHGKAGEQLLRHYGQRAPRIAVPLAMHFERGRNWARAIEFLLLAGDNAARVYASTQAEQHYTRALALAPRLPRGVRAETECRIYEKRAALYLATSRFDPSIADCREMIERARLTASPELEYAALYKLGNTLFWAHRLHEMQRTLEDLLRLAECRQSEATRQQALALMAQGNLALGDIEEAGRMSQEVIEHSASVDRRTLLGALDVRARIHFFQSEYREAEGLFRGTLEFASESGDAFEMLKSRYFLSLTLINLGRISEAMEVLNAAVGMARRNGDFFWSSRVPNCLGWIHRELQDFETATAFDREGADSARRMGIGEAEANSVINLTFDYSAAGDREAMASAIRSAESILTSDPWFRWRFEIRLRASRAEQTLSSEDALRLLDMATQYGARKYIVTALTLLAKIGMTRGDTEMAEERLNAAVAILREFPAPLVAWKAHSTLGRFYAHMGRMDASRTAYREAASIIGYIAGNVGDQRLREVFLASEAAREALTHAGA